MQALFTRLGFVIPANINSQKVLHASVISSLVFLAFGATLFIGSVQPFSKMFVSNKVADASVNSVNSPSVAVASTTQNFILGVNIANNGLILVSSAKVVSVDNDKIHVVIGWGSADFEWVVQTDNLTKFLDINGKKEVISNINVGSIITITGKLNGDDGGKPLIDAEYVRILS